MGEYAITLTTRRQLSNAPHSTDFMVAMLSLLMRHWDDGYYTRRMKPNQEVRDDVQGEQHLESE